MVSLEDKFNKLDGLLNNIFLEKKSGIENEVGYYIFDYLPNEELAVRSWINLKLNNHSKKNSKIIVIDLYETIVDILIKKGYLERCFEFEKKNGMERIIKAINNMLRSTSSEGMLISCLKEKIDGNSIVFLVGIGKCYPILRSHAILNNLHQVIDDAVIILFYPGKYDGQELILFNQIHDDNFYRACKFII